jgi:single-strand DNA-binding protein
MNVTNIIGNVGKEADCRTVNGQSVLNFTVGVNKSWKDKDGVKQTNTTWFNVAMWGDRGKALAPFVKKGDKIYVSGTVEPTTYTDKNGKTGIDMRMNATMVELLGGKPATATHSEKPAGEPTAQPQEAFSPPQDDDFPY